MKHPPREGDLPREELMERAKIATSPGGPWPGAEVLFKFTCEHCGARCTLEEPNKLYENGECCECGKSTKIEFGGFCIHWTVGTKPKYTLSSDGKSITCMKCGWTSYHPMDVKEKYCGHCHQWHDDRPKMPVSHCPTCGYEVDDASVAADVYGVKEKPRPGDLSICIKCGEILVFGRDLTLSLASLNDLDGLDQMDHKVIDKWQKIIRERRPIK